MPNLNEIKAFLYNKTNAIHYTHKLCELVLKNVNKKVDINLYKFLREKK